MNEDDIIKAEDAELYINGKKYYKLDKYFAGAKGVITPIVYKIKDTASQIEKNLAKSKAFIDMVIASVPEESYQAIFTSDQKKKIARGSIEMMTNAEGNIFATVVDTKTKKIVGNINLEKIKLTPELYESINNFAMQVELAKIAEEIEYVAQAVEEVRKGQENDRLALAYSCEQQLLQVLSIGDPNLKKQFLINLISSAEDSRNKLMLSQKEIVEFLKKQPSDFWGKLLHGDKNKKIDERFKELKESMNTLNKVSLVEALSYQELGEYAAFNISICYYGKYLNDVYLSNPELLERLDSLNESNKKYWSTILPDISKKIEKLENKSDIKLLEDINEE